MRRTVALLVLLPVFALAQVRSPNPTVQSHDARTSLQLSDDISIQFGTDNDTKCEYDTTITPDAMVCGLGADSRVFYIAEAADMGTDWAKAQQTNPHLCVQSADAATTTDRICLSHNQTDGVLSSDGGNIVLDPTGTSVIIDDRLVIDKGTGGGDDWIAMADAGQMDFITDDGSRVSITSNGIYTASLGGVRNAAATATVGNLCPDVINDSDTCIGRAGADLLSLIAGASEGLRIHKDANGAAPRWIDNGTKPACAAGIRGMVWYDAGAASVKDTFEVCAKDAADAYAWRVLY